MRSLHLLGDPSHKGGLERMTISVYRKSAQLNWKLSVHFVKYEVVAMHTYQAYVGSCSL